MTRKYIAKPSTGYWHYDLEQEVLEEGRARTIFEDDEPRPSGLLDRHGNELVSERPPIGFVHFK